MMTEHVVNDSLDQSLPDNVVVDPQTDPLLVEFVYQFYEFVDTGLDLRWKLLFLLLICLFVNVILINCAWRLYGNKLHNIFGRQVTTLKARTENHLHKE